MQTTISEHGIFVGVGGSAMASTSSLPNSNEIVCCYKRLSIDLSIPDTILARRGGISFGAASTSTSRPRLGVSSWNQLTENEWMVLNMQSRENRLFLFASHVYYFYYDVHGCSLKMPTLHPNLGTYFNGLALVYTYRVCLPFWIHTIPIMCCVYCLRESVLWPPDSIRAAYPGCHHVYNTFFLFCLPPCACKSIMFRCPSVNDIPKSVAEWMVTAAIHLDYVCNLIVADYHIFPQTYTLCKVIGVS